MVRDLVKQAWFAVTEPKAAMESLDTVSLETVLGDYCKLLLASGALAGVVTFLIAFVRSFYLDVVRHVDIQYMRLANYYAGIATGTFFFYLFAGTFIFFLLTVIAWIVSRPVDYTRVVKVGAFSMSPVLLFGWVDTAFAVSLLLWMLILLVLGVRIARTAKRTTESEKQIELRKTKSKGKPRRSKR